MPFRVFALAVWLVAISFIAACGKGGGLSLEEYFKRLDEIDQQSSERSDALGDQLNLISDESAQPQERIDAAQSAIPEFVTITRDFLAALDELEPPAEVQKDHKEALDAGEDAAVFFDDLVTGVEGVESIAELDQALSPLDGPEFTSVDKRFTDSCLALETTADENQINVDLNCGN